MKKFSQISKTKIRRINEAEVTLGQGQMQTEPQAQSQGQAQGQSQAQAQAQYQQQAQPQAQAQTMANLPQNYKEEQPEPQLENGGVSNFFSKLFESREMAHIYHLQVKDKGLAPHLALNDYYEGVIDLIDNLVEVWQGQYEIVENYDTIDTKDTNSKEKIEYFTELAQFIKTNRTCISMEDSHLHNIIDEIVALIYKTLYKLKYL